MLLAFTLPPNLVRNIDRYSDGKFWIGFIIKVCRF